MPGMGYVRLALQGRPVCGGSVLKVSQPEIMKHVRQ